MRAARINRIAKIIDAKRYLEIGVYKGATFFNVHIPHKVGVDPVFQFDVQAYANSNTVFHQRPSDEYFAIANEIPFDLIYLDGLHTFEQTLRDFLNSFSVAHPQTVWVIDDTVPRDNFAALPDQLRCARLREHVHGEFNLDWPWMGDVYKVPLFIRSALMFHDFRTFRGHGQTVVWKTEGEYHQRQGLPLTDIGTSSYEDLLENFALLNPASDDEIYDAVARACRR